MPLFDLPLETLREYRPDRVEPSDFDDFWSRTVGDAGPPGSVVLDSAEIASPLHTMSVHDVTFAGFGGDPIKAWYLQPRSMPAWERPACVLHLPGYNSGRGYPHQWLACVAAGLPVFVMDVRGQGGAGSDRPGDTGDTGPGSGAEAPGFLTRGIASPDTFYLRRLYTDAYRAADAAMALAGVSSVAIVAGSQGAGVGLAVAGLRRDIGLALLDVPSFALFRRATEISGAGSRAEIARYLSTHRESIDDVFATLSYFDTVNFATRASAPARFSVGLMDQVCPPSTVFASYNYYAGPKDIDVWPYNGHEGGGALQVGRHLSTLTGWAAGDDTTSP